MLAFAATLDAYHFYTTDEVLTELLAFYSTANPTVHTRAVAFVHAILDDADITVINFSEISDICEVTPWSLCYYTGSPGTI